MEAAPWILNASLQVLESVDDPYLMTARGTLGGHEVALQLTPDTGQGMAFEVFLDGMKVFELGMAAPAEPWFKLCREEGYDAETHWDLDPPLILFQQVVPALTWNWREHPLPYQELGLPEGVTGLARVRAAWAKGVAALGERDAAEREVAACLRALPLRAVVFHDDPGHREDFLGTAVDDPLLGVFLRFGRSRAHQVNLAKGTLNGTGGLRWSSWEAGGQWQAEGREWHATQGPEDFYRAAGQGEVPAPGFKEAFAAALAGLIPALDAAAEAYRQAYPAPLLWHRDPYTRYLNHMIVRVRREAGLVFLVLDDGSELAVAGPGPVSLLSISEAPAPLGLKEPPSAGRMG